MQCKWTDLCPPIETFCHSNDRSIDRSIRKWICSFSECQLIDWSIRVTYMPWQLMNPRMFDSRCNSIEVWNSRIAWSNRVESYDNMDSPSYLRHTMPWQLMNPRMFDSRCNSIEVWNSWMDWFRFIHRLDDAKVVSKKSGSVMLASTYQFFISHCTSMKYVVICCRIFLFDF